MISWCSVAGNDEPIKALFYAHRGLFTVPSLTSHTLHIHIHIQYTAAVNTHIHSTHSGSYYSPHRKRTVPHHVQVPPNDFLLSVALTMAHFHCVCVC